MNIVKHLVAAALTVALGATAATASAQGFGAGAGFGGQAGGGAAGGGAAGNAAPVPQYWVADALIFIGNAANTANIMAHEQAVSVQSPGILTGQSRFLAHSTARALRDLHALAQNAGATNPQAVPAIRAAMAELVAAEAQSRQVQAVTAQGQLGPTYFVTLNATLGHLQAAQQALTQVAQLYGGL